jgi:hypothetical protein
MGFETVYHKKSETINVFTSRLSIADDIAGRAGAVVHTSYVKAIYCVI